RKIDKALLPAGIIGRTYPDHRHPPFVWRNCGHIYGGGKLPPSKLWLACQLPQKDADDWDWCADAFPITPVHCFAPGQHRSEIDEINDLGKRTVTCRGLYGNQTR